MTEQPCEAVWDDELNTTDHTYPCHYYAGHDGPHRNIRHGITWGGPHDWFGTGDAA